MRLVDCPVCEPESPFRGDKPLAVWKHRTVSELFTLKGRKYWREERKPEIIRIHEGGHPNVVLLPTEVTVLRARLEAAEDVIREVEHFLSHHTGESPDEPDMENDDCVRELKGTFDYYHDVAWPRIKGQ